MESFGDIYPWIWVLRCQENLLSAFALVFTFKLNGHWQSPLKYSNSVELHLCWCGIQPFAYLSVGRGEESLGSSDPQENPTRGLGGGLDHGADKLFNGVPGWLEVPGFCSDSQKLGIQTQSETEKSKIQLACNCMSVQGLFTIPLLWLLTHNPSPAPWRYLYQMCTSKSWLKKVGIDSLGL